MMVRDMTGGGTLRAEYECLHLVATMAAPRHPLRAYIVALFRHGDLVSVHEATLICDASRQAISKWIKVEGIDIGVRRSAYIIRLMVNAQRYLEGLPPLRKPTKKQMRRIADKALRDWNAANANRPH